MAKASHFDTFVSKGALGPAQTSSLENKPESFYAGTSEIPPTVPTFDRDKNIQKHEVYNAPKCGMSEANSSPKTKRISIQGKIEKVYDKEQYRSGSCREVYIKDITTSEEIFLTLWDPHSDEIQKEQTGQIVIITNIFKDQGSFKTTDHTTVTICGDASEEGKTFKGENEYIGIDEEEMAYTAIYILTTPVKHANFFSFNAMMKDGTLLEGRLRPTEQNQGGNLAMKLQKGAFVLVQTSSLNITPEVSYLKLNDGTSKILPTGLTFDLDKTKLHNFYHVPECGVLEAKSSRNERRLSIRGRIVKAYDKQQDPSGFRTELVLQDITTSEEIFVRLWDHQADKIQIGQKEQTVLIKNVVLRIYQGERKLETTDLTTVTIGGEASEEGKTFKGENEYIGIDEEDTGIRSRMLNKSYLYGSPKTLIPLLEGNRIDIGKESALYIVKEGALKLCFKDGETKGAGDQSETVVRHMQKGASLYSIFNIAAEVIGYKLRPVVYAEATEDSYVECFELETIVRMAQKDDNLKIKLLRMMLIRYSSMMRLIHSIRGIKPEVYMESIPDVESHSHVEIPKTHRSGKPLHCKEHLEEFTIFECPLLWGKDVKSYEEKEPRNTHGLLNDEAGAMQITDGETITSICSNIKILLPMDKSDELQQYISVFKIPSDVEIAKRYCEVMDLVYVVEGSIIITHNKSEDNEHETEMKDNTLHGVVSVLTGEILQFDIKAGHNGCTVAFMSRKSIFHMIRNNMEVMSCLCNYEIRRMSQFLRVLEITLDCKCVEGSSEIPLTNESNSEEPNVTFVLSGRLRVEKIRRQQASQERVNQGDKDEVIQATDYVKGELIVVDENLMETNTEYVIKAIRTSEIVQLPKALCQYFTVKHPLAFYGKRRDLRIKTIRDAFDIGNIGGRRQFTTVVCIPLSDTVPMYTFQETLKAAVERCGTNFAVKSRDYVQECVPREIKDSYLLTSDDVRTFLGNLENPDSIICYNPLPLSDFVSGFILKQADAVFLIGEFQSKPRDFSYIKEMLERKQLRETEKALILLHKKSPEGMYSMPVGTTDWINQLGGRLLRLFRHFHIRCPDSMFSSEDDPGSQSQASLLDSNSDRVVSEDFNRLAGYSTRKACGLVLSGGGARGVAHVGIIKALQEYNKPIAAVGGTSMGAFVGALYCNHTDLKKVEEHVHEFCTGIKSMGRLTDCTLPVLSLTSGKFFNKRVKEAFGDIHFEDLWLPYFNIATDVTNSKIAINTSGLVWEYVRASMSIPGFFPPICPTDNNRYLLDGGSINNLPADVMKWVYSDINSITAVDVSAESDTNLYNYGHSARGCWILYWSCFRRREDTGRIPWLRDVVTRLACVPAEEQIRRVRADRDVDYIRPNGINSYGLQDFQKHDLIQTCGYEAGINHFDAGRNPQP